jgi:hypothetical protein
VRVQAVENYGEQMRLEILDARTDAPVVHVKHDSLHLSE